MKTWWKELEARKQPMWTIATLAARGLAVHFLRGGYECTITKRSRVLWWGLAPEASPSPSHDALIDAVESLRRELTRAPMRQAVTQ